MTMVSPNDPLSPVSRLQSRHTEQRRPAAESLPAQTAQTAVVIGLTRIMRQQNALIQDMSREYEHAATELAAAHYSLRVSEQSRTAAVFRLQQLSVRVQQDPIKMKQLVTVVNDLILTLGGTLPDAS